MNVGIGHSIDSETTEVKVYKWMLDGKEVWFMDTPGFDDSREIGDTDILKSVGKALAQQYEAGLKINGVLYLHNISNKRFTGTISKNLTMFQKLVGEESLKNVILATTMWDTVLKVEGENREKELNQKHWEPLSEFGMAVRRIDSPESRLAITRELTAKIAVALQVQVELVDQHLPLEQTAAGKQILGEIIKATEDMKRQMKDLSEELQKSKEIGEKNMKEMQKIMEADKRQLDEELRRAAYDRETLQKTLAELRDNASKAQRDLNAQLENMRISAANERQQRNYEVELNQNGFDYKGGFPLYWAADEGRYEDVKRMLESGAFASRRTRYDWTPLHMAVDKNHTGIVELLLSYNADVNARSDVRKSPLDMAKTQYIRQLLIQRGAR